MHSIQPAGRQSSQLSRPARHAHPASPAVLVNLHQAKVGGALGIHRQAANGDVGAGGAVVVHKLQTGSLQYTAASVQLRVPLRRAHACATHGAWCSCGSLRFSINSLLPCALHLHSNHSAQADDRTGRTSEAGASP